MKTWNQLDKSSKNKLENWFYKITSQNLDVNSILQMNQQEFINNGLMEKTVKPKTFDAYKRNIKQINLYPERFQEVRQLCISKRFIKENIETLEVIEAFSNSSTMSFRKSKKKRYTTKYHIFLNKNEFETTDYKIYLKYKFIWSDVLNGKDDFENGNAKMNNWFSEIETFVLHDINEIYDNFREMLELEQPKYIGLSVVFETFDSKSNQYIANNHFGIRTTLQPNFISMKNLFMSEMISLANFFSRMNKSFIQYYIYESVIHLNLQSKRK